MTTTTRAATLDDLIHGPTPSDDGWGGMYRLFNAMAPPDSRLRALICAYFRPKSIELADDSLLYRGLGVGLFGRFIPTGGIGIRRATGAAMKPYTLARTSLRGARDFYFRTCVFEALHLPFFVALLALAAQRYSIGRIDYAVQETIMNVVVNLYPMLHHRHTRARIVRLLARRESE